MRKTSQIRFSSTGASGASGQPGVFTRVVGLLVGITVFGLAVFLGAVFIAGFIGLVLIGSLVFTARLWWMRRKMEQYQRDHGDLDAQYTVVRNDTSRPVE
jgi:predicted lipid-binding transport protein (Tim44 family)